MWCLWLWCTQIGRRCRASTISCRHNATLTITNQHPVGCEAHLAGKYLLPPIFSAATFDLEVIQTDLVFVFMSLVGLGMQDYNSLCAAVTICAPHFARNWIFAFWPLWPRKVGQTAGAFVSWCIHVRCICGAFWWPWVTATCRDNARMIFSYEDLQPSKSGQVTCPCCMILVHSTCRSVHERRKSLCAAVTICAILVNIKTHTQTHRQHLTSLFEKLSQLN